MLTTETKQRIVDYRRAKQALAGLGPWTPDEWIEMNPPAEQPKREQEPDPPELVALEVARDMAQRKWEQDKKILQHYTAIEEEASRRAYSIDRSGHRAENPQAMTSHNAARRDVELAQARLRESEMALQMASGAYYQRKNRRAQERTLAEYRANLEAQEEARRAREKAEADAFACRVGHWEASSRAR